MKLQPREALSQASLSTKFQNFYIKQLRHIIKIGDRRFLMDIVKHSYLGDNLSKTSEILHIQSQWCLNGRNCSRECTKRKKQYLTRQGSIKIKIMKWHHSFCCPDSNSDKTNVKNWADNQIKIDQNHTLVTNFNLIIRLFFLCGN